MTIEQVRSAFAVAGFQVDQTLGWEWTLPPVSTFRVQTRTGDHLAMVLVYPTMRAAELARARGGTLVTGYGADVWRGNVAIVQTNQLELDRMNRIQNDCENGVLTDNTVLVVEPSATPFGVDLEFLQALDVGARNL
jgi:hypothetical protein